MTDLDDDYGYGGRGDMDYAMMEGMGGMGEGMEGPSGFGAWAILAAIYSIPLIVYDYYQTVNFSFFYIVFWPIAFIWYLADMEGWDANVLEHYTFDFFESVIFTEISWEHLDLKWFKLHYLYLPYMIEQFIEDTNANDWVIPMMFVTLFADWFAFTTGFVALTVFFPINIVYWIVFFIGQFVSLADLEHQAEAPLYEDEEFREWDMKRRMRDEGDWSGDYDEGFEAGEEYIQDGESRPPPPPPGTQEMQ